MEYADILETLYGMMPDFGQVGAGAYKPGLERIAAFNRYLGSPDRSFLTVHIAGTNGKGSVSHMLASVLQSAGYRTGLYTSPHITDFRERIRVDGAMIPEKEVVRFAEEHMDRMRGLNLSFFEATVGMAFEWFERSDVEVAVIETGLGGRLDATNIINPAISIITNIGLEHTAFLGDSIEAIAREKAGIIKREVPVVIGQHDAASDPIFIEAARKAGADLFFAEDLVSVTGIKESEIGAPTRTYAMKLSNGDEMSLAIDLPGDYQRHNLITALAAIHVMNCKDPVSISRRAIREGLATAATSTGLRGRWEIAGQNPLVVFDTGHNAHGIKEVVSQIEKQKYHNLYMVLGFADDKDLDAILPLLPREAHYIFTSASSRRSMPAGHLAEAAAGAGLKGEVVPKVCDAMSRVRKMAAPDDMIFIGGSTFVVAECIPGIAKQ